MASAKSLQVEVVSHEARLWHGAASAVQIPTVDGSLGHSARPSAAARPAGDGIVTVTCANEIVSVEVSGGFASVDSDFITVVADRATVASQ